jgi:hypothetical protein
MVEAAGSHPAIAELATAGTSSSRQRCKQSTSLPESRRERCGAAGVTPVAS